MTCRTCHGAGSVPGFWLGTIKTCPACHGGGWQTSYVREQLSACIERSRRKDEQYAAAARRNGNLIREIKGLREQVRRLRDEQPERVELEKQIAKLESGIARVKHEGEKAAEERDRLQEAVDRACSALESSAYVGGPSEREAWQTAVGALQEVKTQHVGVAASSPTEAGDS